MLSLFLLLNGLWCYALQDSAETNSKKDLEPLILAIGQSKKIRIDSISKKAKWSSLNTNIASVTKKGVVKAKGLGNTTVTVQDGTKEYECRVSVKTMLIGHRGFSSEYPENTKESVEGAFDNGFDGVEVDVWESENGELMVHHDPTLKRTTGKKGYIWDVDNNNRSQFPIINANGIEKYDYTILIPTLQEIAKIVKERNGYLFLHLKMKIDAGYKLSEKGARKIAAIIKKYDLKTRTVLVSGKDTLSLFDDQGLQRCYFRNPQDKESFLRVFKWCKENKINRQVFTTFENINIYGNVKSLSRTARSYGISFGLYTTIERTEYKILTNVGAGFSMSDYNLNSPDLLSEASESAVANIPKYKKNGKLCLSSDNKVDGFCYCVTDLDGNIIVKTKTEAKSNRAAVVLNLSKGSDYIIKNKAYVFDYGRRIWGKWSKALYVKA